MFVNPNKIWIVYMSIFLYFNTSIAQHVYTSIRIYVYTSIRLYTLHLRCFFTFTFIYPSISVSGFDLTFHPLVVIHQLLFCKGIAGREHGKHRNKSYWRKIFNHKQLKLTYRHDGEIK